MVLSLSDIGISYLLHLKNNNQIENVKNAAKHGYTRANGDNSFSKFARTKRIRTMAVSTMPMTPQRIHAGKNDPNRLKEGAREQPADGRVRLTHTAMAASRNLTRL